MPVNYVAPGPVSMAGIYGRNRGGGGDGGGGGVVQIQDDTARQQNQLAAIGLQGRIENDQINQRGQIQSQLAQQAAGLDVWQYQQKVTEQEAMQLRQDQNAIAAIDSDTSLSPLEKMQAKTRIKSRIDWVSERQKRDMQQAQVEMYQAHASQYKQQVALDQERLKNYSGRLEDNIRFVLDPSAKALLEQEIDTLDPTLKILNRPAFDKKVYELGETRKAGWFKLQQPNGKWEPMEKETSAKGAKETTSKGSSSKEPTESHYNTEAEAILKRRGINKDSENFGAELTAEVERQKAVNKEKAAQTSEGKAAAHKEKAAQLVSEYPKFQNAIQASINLNDTEKMAGMMLTKKIQEMVQNFGPPEAMNPELQKVYTHLASNLKKVIDKSGYKPTE